MSVEYVGSSSDDGMVVGRSSSHKISFYNATPVVQYSTTGTTTGFTAGSGTNWAQDDSTYTGNTGSTAYTVGDIVRALKTAGLIAS